jgi:hypothetical protein
LAADYPTFSTEATTVFPSVLRHDRQKQQRGGPQKYIKSMRGVATMRRSDFVLIAVMMVFACAHVIGLQKIAAARSNAVNPAPVIDRHAD